MEEEAPGAAILWAALGTSVWQVKGNALEKLPRAL